jgi:hypothetical protein
MLHLGKPPKIHLWCQNIPVLSVSPAPGDHAALAWEHGRPRPGITRRSSTVTNVAVA